MEQTFRNINFRKRQNDCRQVIYCQAKEAPDSNWTICDEIEIDLMECTPLHIENNVKYFGYL